MTAFTYTTPPFVAASVGGRPGLWATLDGVRVSYPDGDPGWQLALAGIVGSRRFGECVDEGMALNWAVLTLRDAGQGDVVGALSLHVAAVEALLTKRWPTVERLADALLAAPDGVVHFPQVRRIVDVDGN